MEELMEETFEYLENAIEILVLYQHKQIPLSCDGCPVITQNDMNCAFSHEEPGEDAVWFNRLTSKEYFSCPLSMIPLVIYELYDQYSFIKEFGTPMYPKETSALFWWFVKQYNATTVRIENKLQEKNTHDAKRKQ